MAKKQYLLTVDLPEFDKKAAYDHDRPISSLIRTQLLHLHTVENLKLTEKDRTNTNINDLHTELQASKYIQAVTARLHAHGKAEQRRNPAGGKAKLRKKTLKKSRKASSKKNPTGNARKTSLARKRKPRK